MTKTLLLVDDEENILRSLVRLLRKQEYEILTASSGESALGIMAEREVHVILSDQRMPGMTGSELLSRVRQLYPETVRMVLSGFADIDAITDAINRGNIYKFLAKPWIDELLLANIREAFDRYDLDRKGAQFTKIYENTAEGIIITDRNCRMQAVNPAFSVITGYSAEEVIGLTPTLLRSGRHDADFYQSMWHSIHEQGAWTGEIWNRRKDGSVYPQWLNIAAIRDSNGTTKQYVGLFTDITEHKKAEERLRYQAYHDPLTGLPNRLLYTEHLEIALSQANRRNSMSCVMLLDLDHFKYVNDTFGHDFGDRLLITVAHRLRECLRKEDTLARMGGDEFTILLPLVDDMKDISRVSEKIVSSFSNPVSISGKELYVTASIGISLYPDNGNDAETLLKNADAAMYRAKENGRNTYYFFSTDMNIEAQRRLELENDLRRALERNELEMYYQPKVSLATNGITGAEALIRWHHPTRGMVLPGEFIPLAEENGIISPLGEWVLQEVCCQIRRWRDNGIRIPRIAINISWRQFQRQILPDVLGRLIEETGISPGDLELELTEGSIMSNPDACIEILVLLKRVGIAIAIDDFGTGYSSLSYLRRLPIDVLKIDYSFTNELFASASSSELVHGIIEMAHGLKLDVVAEGVETVDQLEFLRENRCDMIQGFLFSRAVTAAEFEVMLREDRRLP